MPPLLLAAFACLFLVFVFARLTLIRHKHDTKELPFIADITHGICPKCGDQHKDAAVIKAEPASFWRSFHCRCGFDVKAHLKSD